MTLTDHRWVIYKIPFPTHPQSTRRTTPTVTSRSSTPDVVLSPVDYSHTRSVNRMLVREDVQSRYPFTLVSVLKSLASWHPSVTLHQYRYVPGIWCFPFILFRPSYLGEYLIDFYLVSWYHTHPNLSFGILIISGSDICLPYFSSNYP